MGSFAERLTRFGQSCAAAQERRAGAWRARPAVSVRPPRLVL